MSKINLRSKGQTLFFIGDRVIAKPMKLRRIGTIVKNEWEHLPTHSDKYQVVFDNVLGHAWYLSEELERFYEKSIQKE